MNYHRKPDSRLKKKGRALAGLLGFLVVTMVTAGLVAGVVAPAGLLAAKAVRAADSAWNDIPHDFYEPELPTDSVMLASDGTVIARFAEFDRQVVGSSQISDYAKWALVATEDVRFYEHHGVDTVGLGRALRTNLSSSSTQGGSTITQQYVKNIMLLDAQLTGDPQAAAAATERTLGRKLSEARRAIELEKRLSKDEILTRYLNLVNFGAGAYGIEAAARRFYSTTADQLTLAQAATLIGVINAPSALNPIVNPAGALERRNLVLDRMEAAGYIDEYQARKAKREPLGLQVTLPNRGCSAAKPSWGHYCDAVLRYLDTSDLLGPDAASRQAAWTRGGLVIHTALDPQAQQAARKAARSKVPAKHRASAVVAVVKPGTGDLVALAFSKDYGTDPGYTQLPLGTKAVFGPGSTMKMFTLAAAAAEGVDFNTILPGGTVYTSPTLKNPESGAFHNYDTSYASNVSVVEATRRSLNTAFIQLEEKVGVLDIAGLTKAMGVASLPLEGENRVTAKEGSFTLGARGIPVVELADAYATIAAGGLACPVRMVTSIETPDGTLVPEHDCQQVLSEPAAAAVTYALRQVVLSGTGTSARLDGRDVAGKTGTSQDVSSAWFAGFTPEYATVVAIADPRGPRYPLVNTLGHYKVYGGTLPAAIFKSTMDDLHEGLPATPMVSTLDNEYLLAEPAQGRAVVPEVRGLSAGLALTALQAAGLQADAGSLTEGAMVGGTEPKAGSSVKLGTTVKLLSP